MQVAINIYGKGGSGNTLHNPINKCIWESQANQEVPEKVPRDGIIGLPKELELELLNSRM